MRQKTALYLGVGILAVLLISAFIRVPIESGPNYITYTKILGLLIFYQPIVLGAYILTGLFFVYKGLKGRIRLV